MKAFDISIIILSKNEERHIKSTLDAVFKQDIDKDFEVIVIDSGSRDSTLDIVKNYPVRITEIPSEEFGHGRTRNQGARLSNGNMVIFLNGDAVPQSEKWLRNLVRNFENDEKIAGVYSRVYPQPECNPIRSREILNDKVYYPNDIKYVKYIKDFDMYRNMNPMAKRSLLAFETISCAIRKELLLKYPFKDIEFGEDLEWSKRVMENGFKIVFEPDSAVIHSHDIYFSFVKTFKKYFDDSKLNSNVLNLKFWSNLPMIFASLICKTLKDIGYVLSFNESVFYKIHWLSCLFFIRLAEFCGIVVGINNKILPSRLHAFFSLAYETKKVTPLKI